MDTKRTDLINHMHDRIGAAVCRTSPHAIDAWKRAVTYAEVGERQHRRSYMEPKARRGYARFPLELAARWFALKWYLEAQRDHKRKSWHFTPADAIDVRQDSFWAAAVCGYLHERPGLEPGGLARPKFMPGQIATILRIDYAKEVA